MANERENANMVYHFPQELTNEDKIHAAAYLNETDENRENAIAEIKRWVRDELRKRIDDFRVLQFLRVCKFNTEKTKIRLRNYYKQQSDLPEWYTNKDPFQKKLQELLDLGVAIPLQKPDNQGRLVLILRVTRHDPKRYSISDLAKLCVMTTELAIKCYPASSVRGCALFIDVANPTMGHIFQYRPYILMQSVHFVQGCFPMRYQTIKLFNAPKFFDVIVKIIKTFMSEKMKNRFYVHSHTLQNCFKDIPAEILPVEYGGTGDTCDKLAEYWKKLIEENCDFFKYEDEDDGLFNNISVH